MVDAFPMIQKCAEQQQKYMEGEGDQDSRICNEPACGGRINQSAWQVKSPRCAYHALKDEIDGKPAAVIVEEYNDYF